MAPTVIAYFRSVDHTEEHDLKIDFEDHKSLTMGGRKFKFNALWLPPSNLSQKVRDVQFMAPIVDVFTSKLSLPALAPAQDKLGVTIVHSPLFTSSSSSSSSSFSKIPTILYYGDSSKNTAELVTAVFSALEDSLGNLNLKISVFGSYVGNPHSHITFVDDLEFSSWFEAMMMSHRCIRSHSDVYESMDLAQAGKALAIKISIGLRSLMILDLDYLPPIFPSKSGGLHDSFIVTSEDKRLGLKSRILLPQIIARKYSILHVLLDCPLGKSQHYSIRDALEFGFQLQQIFTNSYHTAEDSEEDEEEQK